MPKETVLEKYRGKRGEKYHSLKHGVPEDRYMWVAREQARKIQPFVSANDVVEYGVGTGRNLAALVCREKIGYDIADSVREIVDRHGIRFVDDLSLIDDCSVDVTICHHVLEHVPTPYETLEEISGKIKVEADCLLSFHTNSRDAIETLIGMTQTRISIRGMSKLSEPWLRAQASKLRKPVLHHSVTKRLLQGMPLVGGSKAIASFLRF